MRKRKFKQDQRSVSELYGTVLIISLAFVTALLLVGAGWVIVDQLTSESQDSLAQDSMRSVDQGINNIAGGSVNETTTFEFPEGTGTDVSASERDGKFNLTIRTADSDFVDRTRVDNQTGFREITLGTIRHETEDGTITAYQGGGLWRKPHSDGATFIESEPNIDFTGDSLDLGIVNLTNIDAITEGAEVRASQNAEADTAEELQQFMALYWEDKYNPGVTAPVEITITIQSQFADGWATYARERMTLAPADKSDFEVYGPNHPSTADNETVIQLGEIGSGVAADPSPTFGDEDILYAGTSDWAYRHYNDSAHGAFVEDPVDGPHRPTLDSAEFGPNPHDEYQFALYNESGQWLIYNASHAPPRWETTDGVPADPASTEALNTTGPSWAVNHGTNEFWIDPPSWLDESGAAPICVVTNASSTPDVTEYLDEDGEDCLEHMVGIDENLVSPIPGSPEFNVTVTNPVDVPNQLDVGDDFDIEVEVENEGDATGQLPLGVYTINETNWRGTGSMPDPQPEPYFDEAFLLGGLEAENAELDPGENKTYTQTVEARPAMADDTWTVFATTGVDVDVPGDVSNYNDVEYFDVPDRDVRFEVADVTATNAPVEEGEDLFVDIVVNETEGQITESETQDVRLTADDRLIWQGELELNASEQKTINATWGTRDGDAGTVELNASSFDDTNSTMATIEDADTTDAEFEVDIVDTNEPLEAGEELDVDVEVENVGDEPGDVFVELSDFDGQLADVVEVSGLADGDTTTRTLTWSTEESDAGTDDITVEADDDDDTRSVELEDPGETDSQFNITITDTNSPVTGGESLEVTAEVVNNGAEEDTQFVYLSEFDGDQADFEQVTLSDGDSTTVTLTWETTAADNGTADVTVASNDDDDASEVTVSPPAASNSEFEVEIQSDDYGVTAGDTLSMDVEVTNTGSEEDTQIIYLQNFDGDIVDTVEVGPLTPGDSTMTSMAWDTGTDDGGTSGDLTVASNDDNDTAFAEVFDPNTDESNFEVTIQGTNSPVTESEALEVTATIENTGDSSDTQFVVLENFDGGPVAVQEISLSSSSGSNASYTTTFTWDTIVGDAGSGDVSVVSADDTDTAPAEIQPKEEELRDPVDVVFALDETGSMGDPNGGTVIDDDPTAGDTYAVPEGQLWATEELNFCALWGCYYDTIQEGYSRGTLTVGSDADRVVAYDDGSGEDPTAQRIGATRLAIGALNETMGDTAGAVRYSTRYGNAETYVSLTNNLDSVNQSLERTASGGTDISAGLTEAESAVVAGSNDNKFIILLTDGQHNQGYPYPRDTADDIREDITIYTVGFGGADESTLRYIATEGGSGEGEYYEGDNADQLADIFEDIIGEVTEPETPTFEVDIQNTNEPVESGDTLEVTAEVQNTGETGGEKIVSLAEFGDTNVDSESLYLDQGDSTTVTLEWDTTGEPAAEDDVTVTSVDDEDQESVEITPASTPSSDFQIEGLDTNSPVTEGESLTVEATVFNDGAEDTQEIVLWDFGKNEVVDTADLTLGDTERDTVTLAWDTELGDADTGQITVASADDEGTADAEIRADSGDDSEFAVDIDESASALDVEEGETVEFVVDVTNQGTETSSQQIYLQDPNSDGLLDATETSEIAPGDSEELTLTWETSVGDAPFSEDITVASNDDQDTELVNVSERAGTDTDFDVEILPASEDEVVAGETLTVTAEVTNNGNDTAEQNIVLWEFNKSSVADIMTVSLGPDESAELDLSWSTDDDDIGTDDIYVESDDDVALMEATVESPSTGNTDLNITGLSYPDPVSAGNTLSVDVTVENEGAADASGEWLSMELDDSGDTVGSDYQQIDLDAGDSDTYTLEWEPGEGDVGEYDLAVETNDDDRTGTVEVEPVGNNLNIDVVNTNDPITAGETLVVEAVVGNSGSQTETAQIVLRDNETGVEVDYVFDVDVPAGGSESVTLTWDTRIGDGNDANREVSAEIANTEESADEDIQIDEADTDIDDPSIGEPGNPLDIDLDEVEIGT